MHLSNNMCSCLERNHRFFPKMVIVSCAQAWLAHIYVELQYCFFFRVRSNFVRRKTKRKKKTGRRIDNELRFNHNHLFSILPPKCRLKLSLCVQIVLFQRLRFSVRNYFQFDLNNTRIFNDFIPIPMLIVFSHLYHAIFPAYIHIHTIQRLVVVIARWRENHNRNQHIMYKSKNFHQIMTKTTTTKILHERNRQIFTILCIFNAGHGA